MAALTTLGVGGRARLYGEATTEEEVREIVEYAKLRNLPLFVLGGGSNVLISDAGWPGIVLRIHIEGITASSDGEVALFEVGAGEEWDSFVAATVAGNNGGVECLSGIPGSVGGTPVQNVGAYGQEVSETIRSVKALDRETLEFRDFSNEECEFAYRTSIFNSSARDRYIVLKVTFALTHGAAPKIAYADLQKYFAGRPRPSLSETRDAVRQIRQSKGMLLVEGDPNVKSAGSFFKNPIVATERFERLAAQAAGEGLQIPNYPAGDGMRKLSAAWLVEKAGFHKGYLHGNVGISSKHALAIINCGGATAAEVLALMKKIQETVLARFAIELHPEPVFVGFDRR